MSGIAKLYLSLELKCQLSFKRNAMGILIMLCTYADYVYIYIIKDSAEITYTEAYLLIVEGGSKFPKILVLFKDG